MSDISSIVNVTIERGSETVSKQGFGIPLVLGPNATEVVKSYSIIDEVAVDFSTSDVEYIMALAIFSQNPRPKEIKIGKREAEVKQDVNIDITTVTDSVDYTVTLNGTEFTYSSGVGATAASIVDGLVAAIGAGSDPVTLTDNGDDFDIEADVAGVAFTISVDTKMTLTTTTENYNVGNDLIGVSEVDNDYYFVLLASLTDHDLLECAKYVETQIKMFVGLSNDSDIITSATDDIASQLKALNYDRTAIFYTSDTTKRLDCAIVGKMAPKEPGSATWKFKNLNGVAVDTLTSAQRGYATGKSCNIYVTVGGVGVTCDGVVVSGEFIDIIEGTDWLQANIEEEVYSVLVNNDKVPYTNGGIDVIKSVVKKVLLIGIDKGILTNDPAPVVTAPDVSAITTTDKQNRILNNVRFTATYAGAVHKATINGKISF